MLKEKLFTILEFGNIWQAAGRPASIALVIVIHGAGALRLVGFTNAASKMGGGNRYSCTLNAI